MIDRVSPKDKSRRLEAELEGKKRDDESRDSVRWR